MSDLPAGALVRRQARLSAQLRDNYLEKYGPPHVAADRLLFGVARVAPAGLQGSLGYADGRRWSATVASSDPAMIRSAWNAVRMRAVDQMNEMEGVPPRRGRKGHRTRKVSAARA